MSFRIAPALAFVLGLLAQPPVAAAVQPKPKDPTPPNTGSLRVNLVVSPANDPGRFNLRIDGTDRVFGVGNGGAIFAESIASGNHTISLSPGAGGGANPLQYVRTFGGACSATGVVHLGNNSNVTCTVTLTRDPNSKHGIWVRGPSGGYTQTFSICATGSSCTLSAPAGTSIPLKIEVWGGGGGGGAGGASENSAGGTGGGGGGGGGYATTTVTVVVQSGNTVSIGADIGPGGPGGSLNDAPDAQQGTPGFATSVYMNNAVILQAGGGDGGRRGSSVDPSSTQSTLPGTGRPPNTPPNNGPPPGSGGQPGNGSLNGWSGTAGASGAAVSGCYGGAGGVGGAGGGPDRGGGFAYLNDGGAGGHGGYYNPGWLSCVKQISGYELSAGAAGGNGRLVITW